MLRFQVDVDPEKPTDPLRTWEKQAASDLLRTLGAPSNFPCFFSQAACKRDNIVFAFVEGLDEHSLRGAADDLGAYIRRARLWDGDVASAEPLVMFFNPSAIRATTVEDYQAVGWRILQFWHDIDPAAWPNGVEYTPDAPFWTMCYEGLQIFVNMSNPAHKIRRSRNLGRALTFVINPRERFDIVAGDNPRGRHIRDAIRRRVHAYDGLPHSPVLGSFEAGEIEWWQYGLKETNDRQANACPMRMRPRHDQ